MRTASLRSALPIVLLVGCAVPGQDDGVNPFLEDQSNPGKADTAYTNPDGFEVEVDLEADAVAPDYKLADAPAHIGQYAMTYLRERGLIYLESLAEDASSDQRVEWRVDGSWLTAAQAAALPKDKLSHWRIRGINAVLLHGAADGVREGKTWGVPVPLKPYDVYSEAGDTCGEAGGHIELGQSTYWYLWNPNKSGCKATVQNLTVTLSRLLPRGKLSYPEYDQLAADGQITAVILFGQIDDELTDSETGLRNLAQMARWLGDAGFTEAQAPLGRRFTKHVGPADVIIDLYSPREFSGLGDWAHFDNLQKAISEHEIIAYDGHSMLGASDFWGRPKYPDFYQVFLYGGCLGYEYYVQPILRGKGGWDKLDILSSVVEVSADANLFAGPFLAKMLWALEHNYQASWSDILVAVRKKVGDSTFGVSGVRDNCFSPNGTLCGPPPAPSGHRYTSSAPVAIPDNDPAGAASTIEVSDALGVGTVSLELQLGHTYVGDLRVVLSHGGVDRVVWDNQGADGHDIRQTFSLADFAGQDAQGSWTLSVVDSAAADDGTLESWALVVQ